MTPEEYIADRIDAQAKWHSKKAVRYKNTYYLLQILEFILSLSIPVLAGCAYQNKNVSFAIGVVGAVIAFIESLCKLCKFHENWIKYRTISEALKNEKYLYMTKSGAYKNKDFSCLVLQVEQILATGNKEWFAINSKPQNHTGS